VRVCVRARAQVWRIAEGPLLLQLEEFCLQELMHAGVHAASPHLFAGLRRLLGVIHEEKARGGLAAAGGPGSGLDAALARLYAPFLWRALAAPNAVVRRQATRLLFDAFPLQVRCSTGVSVPLALVLYA
jgi:hypothetical protein